MKRYNYIKLLPIAVTTLFASFFAGCNSLQEEYTPIENKVYFAQSRTASYQAERVVIAKDAVHAVVNLQISSPATEDLTITIKPSAEAVIKYNELHATTLEIYPESSYKINTLTAEIKKGQTVSSAIDITVEPLSDEQLDSGKQFAFGLEIESISGNATALAGADKFIYLLAQKQIQPVARINNTSNLQFKLASDKKLQKWTVEYYVNIDKLGTGIGQLNNQALFGSWGSGVEVDGVKRDGEIFTRFGDAPIEGNRLQIKTHGTQMNSNMLFAENTWYHLAFVCENNKLLLYVNGVLDNSMDLTEKDIWMSELAHFGNTDYLKANVMVAQVRVWEVARTAAQIKNNMANVDPHSEGLYAYWKLNEGEGNTFKEATGKHPDGFSKGTIVWVPEIELK